MPAAPIAPLSGRFWRSTFLGNEGQLLEPARAPQGRWHHDGQQALYLSMSPDGCRIALKVYQRTGDPQRGIFPVQVSADRIVDLRIADIRKGMAISLADIHVFWSTMQSEGRVPPTWAISDDLREQGVDGILTPSRSRPDLTHLTLFRWNCENAPTVTAAGSPLPWNA